MCIITPPSLALIDLLPNLFVNLHHYGPYMVAVALGIMQKMKRTQEGQEEPMMKTFQVAAISSDLMAHVCTQHPIGQKEYSMQLFLLTDVEGRFKVHVFHPALFRQHQH